MKTEKDYKILVADENQTFRNNLAGRLRVLGYTVEFANGGFHLLHLLEKWQDYQLIIIHEDMLDMPALEIMSLIRITKSKAELPLIFISKDSKNQEIMDTIKAGANDYIVKSTNLKPIIDKVAKYFSVYQQS